MEIPFNIVVCHRQILSFERRACKKFKESAAKNVVSDFEINCSWSMGSWRLVLSHFSLHNAQIKKKIYHIKSDFPGDLLQIHKP